MIVALVEVMADYMAHQDGSLGMRAGSLRVVVEVVCQYDEMSGAYLVAHPLGECEGLRLVVVVEVATCHNEALSSWVLAAEELHRTSDAYWTVAAR